MNAVFLANHDTDVVCCVPRRPTVEISALFFCFILVFNVLCIYILCIFVHCLHVILNTINQCSVWCCIPVPLGIILVLINCPNVRNLNCLLPLGLPSNQLFL